MAAVYVFLGGGIGSLSRYGLMLLFAEYDLRLPAATITANILAGLVLGLIAGWAIRHSDNQHIMLFGAVGFCGGFSTFSTFSLENVQLWQNGHVGAMLFNILLSVLLCFGSVWLGLRIMGS
jgi:fluoride exporter